MTWLTNYGKFGEHAIVTRRNNVAQIRNQLKPDSDAACTSFSIGGSATLSGNGIVAQNRDNDPALDPFTVVLTRRPTNKPAMMTVTQAGLIAYIGMNDAGIGICLNTLPAPSRTIGVPHYFTVRGIYESTSLEQTIDAVRRANRAVPANIMMITPQGPANLEVTVDNIHVLRSESANIVTHTNHCLHPDLVSINSAYPELIESHPRLDRVNEQLGISRQRFTIEQLKNALRDHSGHPKSICRHSNDHPYMVLGQLSFQSSSSQTLARYTLVAEHRATNRTKSIDW